MFPICIIVQRHQAAVDLPRVPPLWHRSTLHCKKVYFVVNSRLHCISYFAKFFPPRVLSQRTTGRDNLGGLQHHVVLIKNGGVGASQRAAVMFPIVCTGTRYDTSLHETAVNGPRQLLLDHRLRSHKRYTCEEFAVSLLLYCVFLAFSVFGFWAGAAVLNLLGIFVVFGLGVGVTIAGAGAELAAVVSGV